MGLDYSIQYKKGSDNGVAYALSRRESELDAATNSIIVVQPKWMDKVIKSYDNEGWANENLTATLVSPAVDINITVSRGLLRYKNRLYVGSAGDLRRELILKLHESAIGGHSGQLGTYKKMKSLFYWKGMKKDVVEFVQACDICQRCKHEYPKGGLTKYIHGLYKRAP